MVSAVAGTGQIGPVGGNIQTLDRRFSVRQTAFSCRFRSVFASFEIMQVTAALAVDGSRQRWSLRPSDPNCPIAQSRDGNRP